MLGGSGGEEVSLCAAGNGEPVVLRVVGEAPADAAVAASTAESPHVAPLLDLFSLPGDRFGLVYPRLPGGTLAQLLARRAGLAAGEATTILVSVARALTALHSAGVAHGALRPAAVLFDASGTPVLADLTACVPATEQTRAADLQAFAALAAAVLSGVPGSEVILSRLTGADTSLPDIENALFDAADPSPVEFPAAEAPTIEQLLPSRSSPPAVAPPSPPEGPAGLMGRARQLLGALRTVRRRVWVPAMLAAAGLVAALLLVPGGDSEATTGTAPATSAAPLISPSDTAALRGDDPVTAALALAQARDACLASGAAGCLEAVDQPGSTLLEADLAAVGPPPPTLPDPSAPATVQRTGDAALVTVGDVRLLLVRLEKEWRLRDVFAAEPPMP